MTKKYQGKLITFEGAEGSGKSTQAALLIDYLQKKNKSVLHLREPGGVKISEAIREVLLNVAHERMTKECETLLYMAARAQLVHELIRPALAEGKIVLCDRFLDSTVVYQGFGFGVDIPFIKQIGKFVTHGITPDLTIIFDIDAQEGLNRRGSQKDRIEQRPLEYHNRVREGYLKIANEEPQRIKIIKVDSNPDQIQKIVRQYVDPLLAK